MYLVDGLAGLFIRLLLILIILPTTYQPLYMHA